MLIKATRLHPGVPLQSVRVDTVVGVVNAEVVVDGTVVEAVVVGKALVTTEATI